MCKEVAGMNLRQLYYFKELAEQKQFSKAAKNLNISQPSLSNSLKSLEKELGCQLINRSSGQVFLTEYGQIFYKTAISSVSSLESAKNQIQQLKLAKDNTISIGSIPTAFSRFLIPTLQKYREENKSTTKFIFQNSVTQNICEGIRSGKFSFGICAKIDNFPDLTFIPLYKEPLVVITNNKHFHKKKSISLNELENFNIITYSDQLAIGKKIKKNIQTVNKNINIENIGSENLSIVAEVIANNETAIIVDDPILDQFNFTKLPINQSNLTATIYLALNKTKNYNKQTSDVIEYLSK